MSLFPNLPTWAQNLASILPLSALIEFVDVSTELHVYELRNSVPRWNWPVTPSGARLLLSQDDTTNACCLDRPQRSTVLECFDGRFKNTYPCSTPTTTRLWLSRLKEDETIPNNHTNMDDPAARKQSLTVVHLSSTGDGGQTAITDTPTENGSAEAGTPTKSQTARVQHLNSKLQTIGARYIAVSLLGWLGWVALAVLCFYEALWLAGAYLLLMPMTGFVVGCTNGDSPRKPIRRDVAGYRRMIIATGSENAIQWYAFVGDQRLLNGLLNLPLLRPISVKSRWWHSYAIRTMILSQWALAIGSSALEDWNAWIIFLWVFFCILMSAYGYPSSLAAIDWLERNCEVKTRTINVQLSSRTAMLAALATMNPDGVKPDDRAEWFDRILGFSSDQKSIWEAMLIELGAVNGPQGLVQHLWWWRFVEEGVAVGKDIKRNVS